MFGLLEIYLCYESRIHKKYFDLAIRRLGEIT